MKLGQLYNIALAMNILIVASCTAHPSANTNLGNSKELDRTYRNSNDSINNANTDSLKIDSLVYQKIEAIPEVDKLMKSNTSSSGNNAILIAQRPDGHFKYYWVQVGIMHPDRFEPMLNFYVTPNKYEVLYYNTEMDTTETLQKWRQKEIVY